MITENSFSKKERICAREDISSLFDKGDSFFAYPFKCVYNISDAPENLSSKGIAIRVMISVGKRYHKRAVRRNRVKRLIREAYRLNKSNIYPEVMPLLGNKMVDICYIYTAKGEEDFKTVENGIKKSFNKLVEICKKGIDTSTVTTD